MKKERTTVNTKDIKKKKAMKNAMNAKNKKETGSITTMKINKKMKMIKK